MRNTDPSSRKNKELYPKRKFTEAKKTSPQHVTPVVNRSKNSTNPVSDRRPRNNNVPKTLPTKYVDPVVDRPTNSIPFVIDSIFQNHNNARQAFANNLKDRSNKSVSIVERSEKVFSTFNPRTRSPSKNDDSNYKKPGENLAHLQKSIINKRIASIKQSNVNHSIRVRATDEIKKHISEKNRTAGNIAGTMDVSVLTNLINSKLGDPIPTIDAVFLKCKAEMDAKKRMEQIINSGMGNSTPTAVAGKIENSTPAKNTDSSNTSNGDDSAVTDPDASSLTFTKLVKENVDLQMDTATSPESQLLYSIPSRANQTNIHDNIQNFELRSGPSDVTAYHDFSNLQIAFENVWEQVFDDQIHILGKKLFEEYVKLRDFSGVDNEPDPTISSIDDLRQLMAKIKDFSQLTIEHIPPSLKSDTSGSQNAGNGSSVIDDAVTGKGGWAIANPIGAVVTALINAFSGPATLTWDSFSGTLPDGDIITFTQQPGIAADSLAVEFCLQSGGDITWWKAIEFTAADGTSAEIWNQDHEGGRGKWGDNFINTPLPATMSVPANKLENAVLQFKKAKGVGVHTGMYLLRGLDTLQPGTRVTFTWVKD